MYRALFVLLAIAQLTFSNIINNGHCITDSQCDDSNFCTTDECRDSKCFFELAEGCCHSDSDCDDANPCTVDRCDANRCDHIKSARCKYDPSTESAAQPEDKPLCLSNGECSDNDVCTDDNCHGPSCEHRPVCEECSASTCPTVAQPHDIPYYSAVRLSASINISSDAAFISYSIYCTSISGLCPTPSRIVVSVCAFDLDVFVTPRVSTAMFGKDEASKASGLVFNHPSEPLNAVIRIPSAAHRIRVAPVPYVLRFGDEYVVGTVDGVVAVSCGQ